MRYLGAHPLEQLHGSGNDRSVATDHDSKFCVPGANIAPRNGRVQAPKEAKIGAQILDRMTKLGGLNFECTA